MTVETLISTAETAYLLYQRLGPMCNWTHYLDCCRVDDGYEFLGLRLLPYGKAKDCRSWRPRYEIREVVNFIRAIRDTTGVAVPAPIRPIRVEVTPGDSRPWQVRKLTPLPPTHSTPAA